MSQAPPGSSCFPASLSKLQDMSTRCSTSLLEESGPNGSPVQNNKSSPKMFLKQHTSLVFINAWNVSKLPHWEDIKCKKLVLLTNPNKEFLKSKRKMNIQLCNTGKGEVTWPVDFFYTQRCSTSEYLPSQGPSSHNGQAVLPQRKQETLVQNQCRTWMDNWLF